MEYVSYEKFNRLCGLFFFIPGTVFKQKNDSENLYMIMTSMARDKASILEPVSLIFCHFLTFFICRNLNL